MGWFEETTNSIFKKRPTQRAPDGWESARFLAVFWLGVGSVKAASSRPAHPRVTHTVSQRAFFLWRFRSLNDHV
jgi:hypothetical protein